MTDYFITKERPPTKEDADEMGNVLAWMKNAWRDTAWRVTAENTERFPFWQPLPPPPKSQSDIAFEEWHLERWKSATPPITIRESKAAWDARGEWERSAK